MEEKSAATAAQSGIPADSERSWFGKKVNNGIKRILRFVFRTFFSARVRGLENLLATKGENTLIVANHISFLDGTLLAATLPNEPIFAIDSAAYEKGRKNLLFRFLMSRMDMCPIDETKASKLRSLADKIKNGRPVVIFPEGRLTTTGTLMQIFEGTAFVADESRAKIVPVHLGGMEFLSFGTTYLRQFPTRLFPRIAVTVTKPQTLEIDDNLKGKPRRAERLRQLEGIMEELSIAALDPSKNLFDELRYAARHFGHKYIILDDAETDASRKPKTYGDVITGTYALGCEFRKLADKGEFVGYLLPNAAGSAIAFWGLQEAGCVPAMLNASADVATIESCVSTAALKTIITSRKFIANAEKLSLGEKIEVLSKSCKIVYLEDLKQNISALDKIRAKARMLLGLGGNNVRRKTGSDPAVILFTSGSEGTPKGVALSSTNILSNITQMSTITDFSPRDKVFNAMPTFHAFGLSGGMLMPMLKGLRSYQYPSPLDGKNIPRAIYFYDATIMFGTNTFLKLYARNASDKDMISLRRGKVFAGAEALEPETSDTYFKRFGIQILEGYGMTEASPVVSVNVPGAYQQGTIGRLLPGMEARLEAMTEPGMEGYYRLEVKGPNVMLGYIKADKPGEIQTLKDGWHDTGDLIRLRDKDGGLVVISEEMSPRKIRNLIKNSYIQHAGRLKRFAKPGGEMVALDTIETIARAASPSPKVAHAVIAHMMPGAGEQIVLFTTDPEMKREKLNAAAQTLKRGTLGIPKDKAIIVIDEMPRLGTGKTDYVTLKNMYEKILAEKSAASLPGAKEMEGTFNNAAQPVMQALPPVAPPVTPIPPKPPTA